MFESNVKAFYIYVHLKLMDYNKNICVNFLIIVFDHFVLHVILRSRKPFQWYPWQAIFTSEEYKACVATPCFPISQNVYNILKCKPRLAAIENNCVRKVHWNIFELRVVRTMKLQKAAYHLCYVRVLW